MSECCFFFQEALLSPFVETHKQYSLDWSNVRLMLESVDFNIFVLCLFFPILSQVL